MARGRPRLSTPYATHLAWGTCAVCGMPFIIRGQRKKTCGRAACRAENTKRNRQATFRQAEYVDGKRICPDCRRPYEPTPGTRLCPECSAWKAGLARSGHKPSVAIEVRACVTCGDLFVVRASSSRKTCRRRECQLEQARQYYESHHTPAPARTIVCRDCGVTFTFQGRGAGSKIYCDTCAAVRKREAKRRQMIRHNSERRGALRGGENFSPYEIAERDGWLCYLCGWDILEVHHVYRMGPHPLGPTIDHIVPVADGGSHTVGNVAASHAICNSIRRERPPTLEVMAECRQAVEALLAR